MKPKLLITFSIPSICSCLISCKKNSTSTTYITNNEIPVGKEETQADTLVMDTELDTIEGAHSAGKLYLRYDNNTPR